MTAAGLTDAELARRTGWTSQQINRVRRGLKRPSKALALALARELGGAVSVESIMAIAPAEAA